MHPLTDPKYTLAENKLIKKIISRSDFHPYELITQMMLINLVPLIKAFSENEQGIVAFHLPTPEYLLYALKLYLNKKMSKAAIAEYLQHMSERKKLFQLFFLNFKDIHGIEVIASSPLDLLNIEEKIADLILSEQIPTEETVILEFKEILISQDESKIWEFAFQQNSPGDFLNLNELSYTVHVANSAYKHPSGLVCLLDSLDERKIGTQYAEQFSTQFGPALGMHWIPPILLNDDKKNSLYFCGPSKDQLLNFISKGFATNEICRSLEKHEPALAKLLS